MTKAEGASLRRALADIMLRDHTMNIYEENICSFIHPFSSAIDTDTGFRNTQQKSSGTQRKYNNEKKSKEDNK